MDGLAAFRDIVKFQLMMTSGMLVQEAHIVYAQTLDLVPTPFIRKTGEELNKMATDYIKFAYWHDEKPDWLEYKQR